MKKIIGLCLSLAILAALLVPAASAEEAAAVQASDEVEQFMAAFGLVDADADGNVTRGEFAGMLYQVLKRSGVPEAAGGEIELADVDGSDPNAAAIRTVALYGYMRGDALDGGGYRFRSDDPALQSEVVKVLVELTNYGNIAYYKGGYPLGYASVARTVGILDQAGYEGEVPADLRSVKTMLYNALRCDLAVENEFNEHSITFDANSGMTYLTQNWKVYEISGALTANSVLNVNGLSPAGENRVKIGEEIYESNLIYENQICLGQYVTAYYQADGYGGREIVCMYPKRSRSDRKVFRAEDVKKTADLSAVEVWNGQRYQTYRLSQTADIYFNFSYLGPVRALNPERVEPAEMLALLGQPGSCELILTDYTGDGAFDFLWVRRYENYLLKEFTFSEYKISDAYDRTLKMREAYEKNNVVLLDGQCGLFSPSNFEANDVISIITDYEGEEVSAAVGYVSQAKASGAITSVSDGEYTIGGERYQVSREYQSLCEAGSSKVMELKLGLDTTFYISAFGEIVGASKAESYETGVSYAFVIQAALETGLSPRVTLRALSQDGEIKSYDLASSATLNGVRTKQDQQFAFFTKKSKDSSNTICTVYRLAKLTLKNGLVTQLELSELMEDVGQNGSFPADALYPQIEMSLGGRVTVVENLRPVEIAADGNIQNIVYKSNTFGKMVGVTSSTIVFEIPSLSDAATKAEAISDDDAFYTSSANSFQGDCGLGIAGKKSPVSGSGAYMQFYDLDNTNFASVVVRCNDYSGNGGSGDVPETQSDCIIVESVGDGLNADGEKVKVINGYQAGSAVSLNTLPVKDASAPWQQFSGITTLSLVYGDGSSADQNGKTVKPGDVLQVSTNPKGAVTNIIINMRGGEKEKAAWIKEGSDFILVGHGNQYLGVNYGEIRAFEDGKAVLYELDGKTRVYSLGSPNVTVYSRRNDQVRKGSLQDIEIGGDLFIRQYYSQVKEIVIYQD